MMSDAVSASSSDPTDASRDWAETMADTNDYQILVVEDERHMARVIELILQSRYSVSSVHTGGAALEWVNSNRVDLVILDIGLPDMNGLDVLRELRQAAPAADVIMVTGQRDVRTVVDSIKLGARDYIQKPFEKEDLLLAVEQAHEKRRLEREVERLQAELREPYSLASIVGECEAIRQAKDIAQRMAPIDINVLITGDSGTGKELFARAIHAESPRHSGPFVALNCARYSGSLLDSALFGHEKGAFTGAERLRRGRFEMANGGTIFLDEIGAAQPDIQSKLLRVIEERCFEREGGEELVHVDVRVVAATHVDLLQAASQGRFREDLYYRLNGARIELPPLRERQEDIPLLVDYFLRREAMKTDRTFKGVANEAMAMLLGHHWQGNVRELANLIQMVAALESGEWITTRYFTNEILQGRAEASDREACTLQEAVESFEKRFLVAALRANNWNRTRTAQSLGVHRNTIENKIAKHNIVPPRPSGTEK